MHWRRTIVVGNPDSSLVLEFSRSIAAELLHNITIRLESCYNVAI